MNANGCSLTDRNLAIAAGVLRYFAEIDKRPAIIANARSAAFTRHRRGNRQESSVSGFWLKSPRHSRLPDSFAPPRAGYEPGVLVARRLALHHDFTDDGSLVPAGREATKYAKHLPQLRTPHTNRSLREQGEIFGLAPPAKSTHFINSPRASSNRA